MSRNFKKEIVCVKNHAPTWEEIRNLGLERGCGTTYLLAKMNGSGVMRGKDANKEPKRTRLESCFGLKYSNSTQSGES
jgi:hypothetical protein